MKKVYTNKKRSAFKSFLLHLFFANIALYIGSEVFSDIFYQEEAQFTSPAIQEDSDYGHLIQKYARQYGLDWRFVSSMIQAESSFRPNVVSSAGAVGLMQVLPWVAHADGVNNISDPEENIRFGLKHYMRHFKSLKGVTLEDTMKINLAAYNAGAGHVRDARKLATYLGLNPGKWKSLEKTLPMLEKQNFHRLTTYGYCQGNSVVTYVNKIFKTYNQYRQKDPAYPVVETSEL